MLSYDEQIAGIIYIHLGMNDSMRDRETERDRDRDGERQRHAETER